MQIYYYISNSTEGSGSTKDAMCYDMIIQISRYSAVKVKKKRINQTVHVIVQSNLRWCYAFIQQHLSILLKTPLSISKWLSNGPPVHLPL